MPDTLLGLAVFAAAVGPGYVFLRIAERWTPRRDRSTLHEAAELVVVGATTTAIAVLAVLALGEAADKIDASQVVANRSNYLIQEPTRSLALLVAVLLIR